MRALTLGEQRIAFLARVGPAEAYRVARAVRVGAVVDAARLEARLAAAVARDERLRTVFSDDAARVGTVGQKLEARAGSVAELVALPLPEGPPWRLALVGDALVGVAHMILGDERWLDGLLAEVAFGEVAAAPPAAGADVAAVRARLAGAETMLELPSLRPRPPVRRLRGAEVSTTLDAGDASDAELLAPFLSLIARYTRRDDLVVGIETPAGLAVGRFAVGGTGRELVARTAAALPGPGEPSFAAVLDALRPPRDPARAPLVQITFGVETPRPEAIAVAATTAHVDLALRVERRGASATARFIYDADAYEADAMARLAGHYRQLFGALRASPDVAASSLPMLAGDERVDATERWNPRGAVAAPRCIHVRFEEIAARTPDAVAVTCAGRSLTYRQLDERANQLARRLAKLGVGRDVRVAVCLDRTPELIATLLGILKAGAAYVPIEPTNPADRIAFVASDARAPVVVTEARYVDKLAGAERTTAAGHESTPDLLLVDESWSTLAAESPARLGIDPGADALAYVIYTSGSTGKPKGCLIEHRHVSRLFDATYDWFHFAASDVWTMFHSAAFDFSVWEIWGALLYGGRLVVIPYLVARSPDDVYNLLADEGVTFLNMTPSAFRQLIAAEERVGQRPLALREVVFGGEALELESLRPWWNRHGDATPRLVNMYGITETTVHVTYRPLSKADLEIGAASVIGVPIPDLATYVVDAAGELVPVGVPGEIWVGGAGVARGYLERPELTAQRFTDDPFRPGGRVYHSGDLARRLPGGDLDYLGRIDQQVKIRGFRIETGEIEAALRRAGVSDTAVVPFKKDGETRLCAYVVSDDVAPLRAALRAELPEYMVPSVFTRVPAIPMTGNGKVDRRALPPPKEDAEAGVSRGLVPPRGALETIVAETFAEVLGVASVGRDDSFFDLGGTSIRTIACAAKLGERLGRSVPVVLFFEVSTVAGLAERLGAVAPAPAPAAPRRTAAQLEPVAIVGMAGRFPGARDVSELWKNLVDGVDSITRWSDAELDPTVPAADRQDPAYVRARGILADADCFDAGFFAMSPREAEVTDPQQRQLLELAWAALESAGHVPEKLDGKIGVYAGEYNSSYYLHNVLARPDVLEKVGAFQAMLGNEKDFVATRIAHKLDLRGPALSIHTACSTSLVAIATAFHALRTGQCDLALAGGAAVSYPQRAGYVYQEGGMLSTDGHTRAFDASAGGTVFSDGAAFVVLRRLGDALADGDDVLAVITGAATNNDGAIKMSFTAPSVAGQAEVIADAQELAGVDPESVSYIEAHGTATPLGDPIEIEGLTRAFRRKTQKTGFCWIGSVKSNFGHLTAAAGATGVIKTALAIRHRTLPASLHFKSPNPKLDLPRTPFVVVAETRPWDGPRPLRAGVSSFGVGGTNAHVVLEEPPAIEREAPRRGPQLLLVSARTPAGLGASAVNLGGWLAAHDEVRLEDVAWTLADGRRAFAQRRFVVAATPAEAAAALTAAAAPGTSREVRRAGREVVFMFPGQGSQHALMGRALYEREPAYREAFDHCVDVLRDLGLRDLIFAAEGSEAAAAALRETRITQPALFTVGYATAALWRAWGLTPAMMIGHSVGEFVAATLAGVMALDDALRLVATRGRLMGELPRGAMLSVRLPAAEVERRLPPGVDLAGANAPKLSIVAGPEDRIAAFADALSAEGVPSSKLVTSHAFHSWMMDPAVEGFAEVLARVPLRAPAIPFVSTVTGQPITAQQATSPTYWARHLRQPVRFADGIATLWSDRDRLLLEVGPRTTLTTLARQQIAEPDRQLAVASLDGTTGDAEWAALLRAAGQLWTAGVEVDVTRACPRARRIALPTYPFERTRHFVAPPTVQIAPVAQVETPPTMSAPQPTAAPVAVPRAPRLVAELRKIFEEASGIELAAADPRATFVELGLDSLVLTQCAQKLERAFKLKLTFRQLIEDLSTLETLAQFYDAKLPPDSPPPVPVPVPVPVSSPLPAPVPVSGGATLVQQVIQQQLALMARQLEMLGASPTPQPQPQPAIASGSSLPAAAPAPALAPAPSSPAPVDDPPPKKPFGAQARIETTSGPALEADAHAALEAFMKRYVARTPRSKQFAQDNRAHLADPRVVTGFKPIWKEIVYPIVVERSKGAELWDIDGNRYVDLVNGFGANYLGHAPPFVVEAVHAQLDRGFEIGPQHPLVADCARLLCELTGHERAAFCNTGSEAVLGATRIARTVTGRDLIVTFTNDYHGIFDEVVVRGTRSLRSLPAAPGVPASAVQNNLVLEYGADEALKVIAERADDIAAVLVEPVQSRNPACQPRAFLHALRKLTAERGIALIFDEMITGFRIGVGGAQEHFGVRADIATYGKVLGGGLPIGAIAGIPRFMDALDGGSWRFGDDSVPQVGVTYFAGTFVRHPLALAACKASLEFVKREGPALQQRINARTAAWVADMNAFMQENEAPYSMTHWSSFFKLAYSDELPYGGLLFFWLRQKGVHIWDGRICFFTIAHSEEDLAFLARAFKETIHEMQDAGLLPRPKKPRRAEPPVPGARLGKDPNGAPAWFVPDPERPGKYLRVGGAT